MRGCYRLALCPWGEAAGFEPGCRLPVIIVATRWLPLPVPRLLCRPGRVILEGESLSLETLRGLQAAVLARLSWRSG